MGKTVAIPNGFLSLVDTDFKCPTCGYQYNIDDYYERLDKSKYFLIYFKCKGCKDKLGLTTDMRGDAKCWLKSEEKW